MCPRRRFAAIDSDASGRERHAASAVAPGKRITALLAFGLVTREVALILFLTERAVRNYPSGIRGERVKIRGERQVWAWGEPHHSDKLGGTAPFG